MQVSCVLRWLRPTKSLSFQKNCALVVASAQRWLDCCTVCGRFLYGQFRIICSWTCSSENTGFTFCYWLKIVASLLRSLWSLLCGSFISFTADTIDWQQELHPACETVWDFGVTRSGLRGNYVLLSRWPNINVLMTVCVCVYTKK